jgi:tRNA pseudouridine38-40 synthase
MKQIVLLIAYDGTNYCGFQFQPSKPTIQGELENAIRKLTGESLRVAAASRTDSGVHALGQVVSFQTNSRLESRIFVDGLNYYLPCDIVVKKAVLFEGGLDVRRSALGREYFYLILNETSRSPFLRRFSFLVRQRLDCSAMSEASRWLIGKHDFASFISQPQRLSTIREVHDAGVFHLKGKVIFYIKAGSFLPHQVRNIVGSLIEVGLGKMTAGDFHSIMLRAKAGLGGPTVPPAGLFLRRIYYKDNFFGDLDESREDTNYQTCGYNKATFSC